MTTELTTTARKRPSLTRVRSMPRGRWHQPAPDRSAAPSTVQTAPKVPVQEVAAWRPAAMTAHAGRTHKKPNRAESTEFRLILGAAFMFFLFTSVIERALPHKWLSRRTAEAEGKSVIEQAREAAHISAGYAFMG